MTDPPILNQLRACCPHRNRTTRMAVWLTGWGGIIEERCTRCGTTWTHAR